MSKRTKTLKLSYPHDSTTSDNNYRVEQVTNSTRYVPGQILPKGEVQSLVELGTYEVVIVPVKAVTRVSGGGS